MNNENKIDKKMLDFIKKVELSKRGRTVIDYLIQHGSITTEDIEKMGYNHPPRAIRDIREDGIPIITKMIKSTNNERRIARYSLGDPMDIEDSKLNGRTVFSKKFKDRLLKKQGNRCAICQQEYKPVFLQIDHRIPYEYSNGDPTNPDIKDFMLLCAECNRKKARATEVDCANTCFKSGDINIIKSCFWASPENYTHVSMRPIRQAEITWEDEKETNVYDKAKKIADSKNIPLQRYIKELISKNID